MRKRNAVRKKLKTTKSEHNKRLIEARLERMDQELKDSVFRKQQLNERTANEAIKTNPKYFYTYAKNKSKLKMDVLALESAEGRLESDPSKLCELFSQQFVRVYSTPRETKVIDNPETFFLGGAAEHKELKEMQFGKADVIAAIQTIRPTAAPGPDEFPAILLKKL